MKTVAHPLNPSQKSLTPERKKLCIEAPTLPSPQGEGFETSSLEAPDFPNGREGRPRHFPGPNGSFEKSGSPSDGKYRSDTPSHEPDGPLR